MLVVGFPLPFVASKFCKCLEVSDLEHFCNQNFVLPPCISFGFKDNFGHLVQKLYTVNLGGFQLNPTGITNVVSQPQFIVALSKKDNPVPQAPNMMHICTEQ